MKSPVLQLRQLKAPGGEKVCPRATAGLVAELGQCSQLIICLPVIPTPTPTPPVYQAEELEPQPNSNWNNNESGAHFPEGQRGVLPALVTKRTQL